MRKLAAVLLGVMLVGCGVSKSSIDTAAPSTSQAPSTTAAATSTVPATSSSSVPRVTTTSAATKTTTTTIKCASEQSGTVTVLAASSMVNAFTSIRRSYLWGHPCVKDLVFSYGSSATIATQIVAGAPGDVFVSANQASMTTVTNAGLGVGTPTLIGRNSAEIMVNAKSRYASQITNLSSLTRASNPGMLVGLCVATAPCGSLANTVLANAKTAYADNNLTRTGVETTEASSVEDLVSKIQSGELDAGIVYQSDCLYAQPRGLATCVPIPASYNSLTVNAANPYYVIALNNKVTSTDFATYVGGSSFIGVLQGLFGFSAP